MQATRSCQTPNALHESSAPRGFTARSHYADPLPLTVRGRSRCIASSPRSWLHNFQDISASASTSHLTSNVFLLGLERVLEIATDSLVVVLYSLGLVSLMSACRIIYDYEAGRCHHPRLDGVPSSSRRHRPLEGDRLPDDIRVLASTNQDEHRQSTRL